MIVIFLVYEDGLCVKQDAEFVLQKIKQNPDVYHHFNPGDGVMKNWLMIIYPEAQEYDGEKEMILEALAAM